MAIRKLKSSNFGDSIRDHVLLSLEDHDSLFRTKDVVIHCRDGKLSTHSIILATMSEMLYAEMKTVTVSGSIDIIIPDYFTFEIKQFLCNIFNEENISTRIKLTIFSIFAG